MKKLLIVLVLVLLNGCAITKQIKTPNGNDGYYISCNGLAVSISVCYEKAAKLCPKGYEIIDKNNNSGVAITPHAIGSMSKKGIFIECS